MILSSFVCFFATLVSEILKMSVRQLGNSKIIVRK